MSNRGPIMESICHIKLSTHSVHIAQGEDGLIHCFKYTNEQCDLEEFSDQFEASDYIMTPFPKFRYVFKEE